MTLRSKAEIPDKLLQEHTTQLSSTCRKSKKNNKKTRTRGEISSKVIKKYRRTLLLLLSFSWILVEVQFLSNAQRNAK